MIQPTSLTRYISGMSALNIPRKEFLGGDWHFFDSFVRPDARIHYAGEGAGTLVDTNAWLGAAGVQNSYEELVAAGLFFPDDRPIYAATPPRAVLDLLLRHFLKQIPQSPLEVEAYFYDPPDVQKLVAFMNSTRASLPQDAYSYVERHILGATK